MGPARGWRYRGLSKPPHHESRSHLSFRTLQNLKKARFLAGRRRASTVYVRLGMTKSNGPTEDCRRGCVGPSNVSGGFAPSTEESCCRFTMGVLLVTPEVDGSEARPCRGSKVTRGARTGLFARSIAKLGGCGRHQILPEALHLCRCF